MKNLTKVIKNGNSWGLRITKQDKERLNIKNGDKLVKNISSDGNQITFSKPKKVNPKVKAMIHDIFKEDHRGIKALKQL